MPLIQTRVIRSAGGWYSCRLQILHDNCAFTLVTGPKLSNYHILYRYHFENPVHTSKTSRALGFVNPTPFYMMTYLFNFYVFFLYSKINHYLNLSTVLGYREKNLFTRLCLAIRKQIIKKIIKITYIICFVQKLRYICYKGRTIW